jgi:GNAT superfamily N-acetyltransferase
MEDKRPTGDDVVPGTKENLDDVLGWLEREFTEGVNDFWHNRRMLPEALYNDSFYVIREGAEAVAFQLGRYSPSIANVRSDRQGQGFGTALLEASVARARHDNVNILNVECSPRTSLTFWEKHGFERYGDLTDWGKLTARRILHRSHDLPEDQPRVRGRIEFYPERVIYSRDEHVEPIAIHDLLGARLPDGAVMLERRVICSDETDRDGGDLAIKIVVDGAVRYIGKTKYDTAEEAGVVRHWVGGAYYLDVIEPFVTAGEST